MQLIVAEVGPLATNCYLLYNEQGDVVIIDPGDDTDDIQAAFDAIPVENKKVQAVVLTHGHFDHLGAANEVADDLSSFIHISMKEHEFLQKKGTAGGREYGMETEIPIIDFEVNEGDVIEAGALKLKVMETPGHSPGSICLYVEDETGKLLFSGDTLFAGSIGRVDFEGGDEIAMTQSLERLSELDPDVVVLPGHGPASTIEQESRINPYWPA